MIRWTFLVAAALLNTSVTGIAAEKRAALVVGVGHYAILPALPNAISDARAVANALGQAGFKVTLLIDPDVAALRTAVAGAQTTAKDASAALFYYAGHAVQFQNRDYLLAADVAPQDADALDDQGLELTDVTMRMAEATLRLVFVDACRESPVAFTKSAEGGRGLAPIAAGVGTTIVFSAASGHAALDGTDGHSPFASALLKHLLIPGLELSPLLREVASDLLDQTQQRQQLQPLDNRVASFFFVPTAAAAVSTAGNAIPSAALPASGGIDQLLAELEPLDGTGRLLRLEDALHTMPLRRGLDAGQTLAILGDIPAPALRRHALALLMPSLLAPISEPETVHLLEGFDGMGRVATLEMLLPCLALPMNNGEAERILADISPPSRNLLAQTLRYPPIKGSSCPAL